MKKVFEIFKSKYCILTFILSSIFIYLLIPKNAFFGYYKLITYPFILSSALVFTCIVRNIKERIVLAKTYQNSVTGIVATGLGFIGLQACGIGLPICGATIGAGILSLLPITIIKGISRYSIIIILIAILIQIKAIYAMNCFHDEKGIDKKDNGNKRNKKRID